jgi:hypothetical protein
MEAQQPLRETTTFVELVERRVNVANPQRQPLREPCVEDDQIPIHAS